MRFSTNYATHIPAILKATERTDGDILELGMGVFSTPLLHYISLLSKRHLVSYDNDPGWISWADRYPSQYHDVILVNDWDNINIEKPWDVVLVDHSPDIRRKEEVKRLANFGKYIIIHDSNRRFNTRYKYSEIYSLFKYRQVCTFLDRHADILSNFVDLEDFWK